MKLYYTVKEIKAEENCYNRVSMRRDLLALHAEVTRLQGAIVQARSDEAGLSDDFQKLIEAVGVVVNAYDGGQWNSTDMMLAVENLRLAAKITSTPQADSKLASANKEIKRLQRERDAYRQVAIEWFSCEGPFPENLADSDVIVDVDARAVEFAKQAQKGTG